MSGTPYIDGNTLEEARNAFRQGISLAFLASQLGCEESHLATLLGHPHWRVTPTVATSHMVNKKPTTSGNQ